MHVDVNGSFGGSGFILVATIDLVEMDNVMKEAPGVVHSYGGDGEVRVGNKASHAAMVKGKDVTSLGDGVTLGDFYVVINEADYVITQVVGGLAPVVVVLVGEGDDIQVQSNLTTTKGVDELAKYVQESVPPAQGVSLGDSVNAANPTECGVRVSH
ncbi:hypothetical protein V6N13_097470 [Hibiscus sabdariffa]|uniref:Uncharacterized protein n=1 Tax=Hibiscus sabdariffa TaxID=183260 RepID=A0ABR1Z8T3_9ROSI